MKSKVDERYVNATYAAYKVMEKHIKNDHIDRDYILKKIDLDQSNFQFENLEKYRNQLLDFATGLIDSSPKESLLFFAEFLREAYTLNENIQHLYTYLSLCDIAIYIQKITLDPKRKINENTTFEMFNMFCIAESLYMCLAIEQKIDYKKNKHFSEYRCNLNELFYEVENLNVDNFFDQNIKYFGSIKIEEMNLYNEKLDNYLRLKELTPDMIYASANNTLEKLFGFNYSDIDKFVFHLAEVLKDCEEVIYKHHVKIDREKLISLFNSKIPPEKLLNILDYLSINKCIKTIQNPDLRTLELRTIVEEKNVLKFGMNSVLESILIFKAISIQGHFYKEIGLKEKEKNLFNQFQNKFSTFFCYVVGDLLDNYGFIQLRDESNNIKVEIKELKLPDGSIFIEDIDVLALDERNKILYNVEIKYFQGKVNYTSILKDPLSMKLYKSFMERNKIISNNKSQIISNLFNIQDPFEYKLKPLIITSRAAQTIKEVTMYSFEELKENLIEGKVL